MRGVRFAEQQPIDTAATVNADTTAPNLWRTIVKEACLPELIAEGVDSIAGEYAYSADRARVILDTGIEGNDGLYAHACACIHGHHRERERPAEFRLYPECEDGYSYHSRVLRHFGSGKRSPLGVRLTLRDLVDGPFAVLRVVDESPTITIRVGQKFKDLTAEQRRSVCQFITYLGTTFDVVLVASGYWQRTLVREHGDQLPAAVSETITATRMGGLATSEIEARVDAARDRYDPDGSAVAILHELVDSPAKTVTYNHLYSSISLTDEGVRNRLVALKKDGLIQTGTNSNGTGVAELLTAGSEVVSRIDAEIGRQQSIETAVSETRNRCDDSRVIRERPHARGRQGQQPPQQTATDRTDESAGKIVTTSPMPGWNATAAAVSAPENGIGLVDYPIEPLPDGRSRDRLSRFDADQERLTVSAECINPLQYGVSLALALVSPWTFRHVLTPDRLEGECGDSDAPIGTLLTDSPDVLRSCLCLGYLKDVDATPEGYKEALLGSGRDFLLNLLTRLRNGDYNCSTSAFRGIILREALGLAGTMVHLCWLCGIDVSRELRMPSFTRNIKSNSSLRSDIVETITKHVSIQSHFGLYAAYRQLCEQREDKRRGASRPVVDAGDPFGEFIGSLTIVGPGVSDLEDELRAALTGMDVHEDAPEFSVPVAVDGDVNESRPAFARALIEMCDRKDKTLRWEQVQNLSGYLTDLLGSPYDVAKALNRLDSTPLGDHDDSEFRFDELRYALGTLDARRVVPSEGKPALSKIIHALVVSGEHTPLSKCELAELAGVSTKSVSTHIETAEEMAVAERHEIDSPIDPTLNSVWFTARRPEYSGFDAVTLGNVTRSVSAQSVVDVPETPEGDPPPIRPASVASIGNRPTQRPLSVSRGAVAARGD